MQPSQGWMSRNWRRWGEKARKKLGKYQIFFSSQNIPFLSTHRFFPTSLEISDIMSCSRVSHQLYLTMEVTYCNVSYVVSGHIPSCHILLGVLPSCDPWLVACGHITAHHYMCCFTCFHWHSYQTLHMPLRLKKMLLKYTLNLYQPSLQQPWMLSVSDCWKSVALESFIFSTMLVVEKFIVQGRKSSWNH